MELHTPRLLLRSWREEDLEPFARLNTCPHVMEFFPNKLTREESQAMVQRFEASQAEHGFGNWACERKEDRKLLGFVGLSVPKFEASFMPCVEIGWRIEHAAWGQGYAPEGAKRALEFAWQQGLEEVLSFTATINLKSIRVMEKIGMRRESEFDHPRVALGHPLRRHVLYRLEAPSHS